MERLPAGEKARESVRELKRVRIMGKKGGENEREREERAARKG